MKNLIWFSLGVLFCFAALAEEKFFKDRLGDNYLISYEQSGKWILEHIFIKEGKLQERIDRKIFNSKSDLKKFEDQKYGQYLKLKSKPDKSKYLTSEMTSKVWEVTQQWNLEWEVKFSEWVKKEFNKDYFVKYKLETDCADVAFALRWIFARENGLPAANTMAGSHVIFSHESMKSEWAKLPRHKDWDKDQLFLAALKYLLRQAYTGTLNIDGYPIEMTKEAFLVGTIHLDGGHTMIISEIDYQSRDRAPIWKLSSTVPAAIRELHSEMMLDSSITSQEQGGLFRMRWPSKKKGKWELIPREQMPYFSKEQYSDEFSGEEGHFTLALIKKLGIPFYPKSIITEAANNTIDYLNSRVGIVEEGFKFCLVNDCEEGGANYEEYSTPTRDNRLYSKFLAVDDLVINLSNFDDSLIEFWKNFKSSNTFTVLGVTKTLVDYELLFKYGFASSHPEDSLEERWGLSEQFIRSALEKRIVRALDKRKQIVKRAQVCIGQEILCKRGTSYWDQFNTYEFDSELKTKIYGSYLNFSDQYDGEEYFKNTEYFKDLKGIPFYISEPSATEGAKWGRHENTTEHVIMPQAKEIVQLNNKFFMLDSKLYNIDSMTFEDLETDNSIAINYVLRSNLLVLFFPKRIEWLDLISGKKSSFNLDENVQLVHWFNDKRFLVKGCLNIEDQTDCRARYYRLLDSNDIIETGSVMLDSVDIYGYTDNQVKVLKSDYDNLLLSASYQYDLELITHQFDFFLGDTLQKHEIKSSTRYSIFGESTNYLIYGSESEIFSFSKQTNQTCRLNLSTNSSFDSVGHDRFIITHQNNITELIEFKSSCQVLTLVKSDSWLEYFDGMTMSLVVEHDKNRYYKIQQGQIAIINFPATYSWARFDGNSLLWIKNSNANISRAYWENLISGQTTMIDPLYLPVSCSKDGINFCYGQQRNSALDIYAVWDNESSVFYAQLKNQVGGPVLTTLI